MQKKQPKIIHKSTRRWPYFAEGKVLRHLCDTRGKAKRNPAGLCNYCKEKIFNRAKSAVFCKQCYKDITRIRSAIYNQTKNYGKKRKNKDYKITIKIKVTKKGVD